MLVIRPGAVVDADANAAHADWPPGDVNEVSAFAIAALLSARVSAFPDGVV